MQLPISLRHKQNMGYERIVRAAFGGSLVRLWTLGDRVGATTVQEEVAHDSATPNRATFGRTLASGETAALFDGAASYITLPASVAAALDWNEVSVFCLARVPVVGTWTDSANHVLLLVRVDASNYVQLIKKSANVFAWQYLYAGGIFERTAAISPTGWASFLITATKSGNKVRAFQDGTQVGADGPMVGTFTGTPATLVVGANQINGSNWNGLLAYVAIGNRALSVVEASTLTPPATPAGVDALDYNMHATEESGYTAWDNTTPLTNALAAGDAVTISRSGTYLLSNVIRLASDKSLSAAGGVILKKKVAYAQMFASANAGIGAATDTNIALANLIFDDAAGYSVTGQVSPVSSGLLQFEFVDGVTISNVSIVNGDATLYGMQFMSAANCTITNYTYDGEKAAAQAQGGCDTILFDTWDVSCHDDDFAVNVSEYPAHQPNALDSSNITFSNGISRLRAGQVGFFCRLITGSWLPWASGNTYDVGHLCVSSGNIYKKVNAGAAVASVAPTHTGLMQDVTGADGITWRWMNTGTWLTNNITNVRFTNITIESDRLVARVVDDSIYQHSVYPGTEGESVVDGVYSNLPASRWWNEPGETAINIEFTG